MKTFQQFMEQTPHMDPSEYTKQVARSSAKWKGQQIRHCHQELGQKASREQSAKRAEIKAIMSR